MNSNYPENIENLVVVNEFLSNIWIRVRDSVRVSVQVIPSVNGESINFSPKSQQLNGRR